MSFGLDDQPVGGWTFVTSHTLVLLCIARDPAVRLNDVAATVGITERRVQSIVADLVATGYLTRTRHGRRNRYEIDGSKPLRHLETEHHCLGELLSLLAPRARDSAAGGGRGRGAIDVAAR